MSVVVLFALFTALATLGIIIAIWALIEKSRVEVWKHQYGSDIYE